MTAETMRTHRPDANRVPARYRIIKALQRLSVALLLTLAASAGLAQSPLARFMYEDAEQRFASGDYVGALEKLSEAERELGKINPPILFLRIMARIELLRRAGDEYEYAQVEAARTDVATFFARYAQMEGLTEKAREVYAASQELATYPASRTDHEKVIAKRAEAAKEAAEVERRERAFANQIYNVGDLGPAGGVIVHDKGQFSGGWRYLEAAPAGAGVPIEGLMWGCVGVPLPFAKETQDGFFNTLLLRFTCNDSEAARAADDYSVVNDGLTYADWFLPSAAQMEYVRSALKSRKQKPLRGLSYWTSSHMSPDFPAETTCVSTGGLQRGEFGCRRTDVYAVWPVRKVRLTWIDIPSDAHEASLGVQMMDVEGDIAIFLDAAAGSPVAVRVFPNSAAHLAGITTGDRITAVNGREVRSSEEVLRVWKELRLGAVVPVTIVRRGETSVLPVEVRTFSLRVNSPS